MKADFESFAFPNPKVSQKYHSKSKPHFAFLVEVVDRQCL